MIILAVTALVVGVLNPTVTQTNITTTICKSGWTKTIRPPASYTNMLKRAQMKQFHLAGTMKDYEEDHLIPLELGGHPTSPNNLWPQPWPDARKKDLVERQLNRKVCQGKMTLVDAQILIRNWK